MKPVVTFFVLTYAVMWACFISVAATGIPVYAPLPGGSLANRADRGRRRRAGPAGWHPPVASGCALVPVRPRLHSRDQADCRAGPSGGHGRVAALWRRAVVSHPGGNRRVDTLPGGRGDRLARLCASPPGGALRTRAREPPARGHLGLLAPTSVLHPRDRHVRTVIFRVCVASNRAV